MHVRGAFGYDLGIVYAAMHMNMHGAS